MLFATNQSSKSTLLLKDQTAKKPLCIKYAIWSILLGIYLVFVSPIALCYEGNNHLGFTRAAFNYLIENNPKFRCADELGVILDEGAVREDESDRPLRHFLPGILGYCNALEWAYACFNANDHNWNTAVRDAQSEEFEGWRHLGYLLHLLEDMSSPAHVRGDPHYFFDPYEHYNAGRSSVPLTPVSSSPGELRLLMESLQSYTQSNNYSDDTVFDPSFPGPVYSREEDDYFYDANNKRIAYKGPRYRMELELMLINSVPIEAARYVARRAAGINQFIALKQFNTLAPITVRYVGNAINGYRELDPKMPTCDLTISPSSLSLEGETGQDYTKKDIDEPLVVSEVKPLAPLPSPDTVHPKSSFVLEWDPPIQNVSLKPMSGDVWFNPDKGQYRLPISVQYSCSTEGSWQGKVGVRRPDSQEIEATSKVTLECSCAKKDCCGKCCSQGQIPPLCCPGDKCSDQWGDPHMTTFDSLAYDFQGVGEFILMKSLVPNDTLEVQVRNRPWGNRNDVSITQAVAMKVATDRVSFYAGMNPALRVNSAPTELAEGGIITLPSGGEIARYGNTYRITWPDDSAVDIRDRTENLDIAMRLSTAKHDQVVGLLGNADDNRQNDVTTRDGISLGTQIKFEDLYLNYADSWRISQQESLFDYAPGETTETFTDRNFPRVRATVADLTEEARAPAEEICRAAGITDPILLNNCILDVALTNNAKFANISADTVKPAQEATVIEPPKPTINDPGFGIFRVRTLTPISSPLRLTLTKDGNPLPGIDFHHRGNGFYESDAVPTGFGYQVDIQTDGYIAEKFFALTALDRQVFDFYAPMVPITPAGQGNITGRVVDVYQADHNLPNIKVFARRYANQVLGNPVGVAVTDQNGMFTLEGLAAGLYTLEFQDESYKYESTKIPTVSSIGGQTTPALPFDIQLAPHHVRMRIVLTWDEHVTDLDVHLTGPDSQSERFHIYHGNRGYLSNYGFHIPIFTPGFLPGVTYNPPYAYLDRYDTMSLGSERILISRYLAGVFRLSVHDYTNRNSTSSDALARSGARVEVYIDSGDNPTTPDYLLGVFDVPSEKEGNLWTVFEIPSSVPPTEGDAINLGTLGSLIPINHMSYVSNPETKVGNPETDYKQLLFMPDKNE